MRKLRLLQGTRADYPRVKSVLKEIKENGKFDLQIIVTGSHLLESHGNSYTEILDDGFLIDKKVEMYIDDFNSPLGMTLATSRCMKGVGGTR